MTTISYEPETMQIRFTGHALSGPYGQDLVCAAVSALYGTLSAALANYGIDMDSKMDGDADVRVKAKPDLRQLQTCRTICETVMSGAELLAAMYPEHVRVTII